MRFARIVLLHFEDALQVRSRSFIWFLIAMIQPMILISYWSGLPAKSNATPGWTTPELNTYYLLVVIAVTGIISHIEEKISEDDIQHGELVRYITRPFPYIISNFLEEIPYRIMQCSFGLIAFFLLSSFIDTINIPFANPMTILIFTGALLLSFILQSSFALIAFWIIDAHGIFNALEIVRIVLSGILIPISLLPLWMQPIAYITPFPYLIYFPIISLQGKAPFELQVWVIFMQLLWIAIFGSLYFILWKLGLKKFSGVGQ